MQHDAAGASALFSVRRAGVLLHPTSLPNTLSFSREKPITQMHGNLGKDAYAFVDFLAEAGISIWQMLPTGPTHADLSPYQSVSAHAGSPELISIDWLIEKKWVNPDAVWSENVASLESLQNIRRECAKQFFQKLEHQHDGELNKKLQKFTAENAYWLDDFVLFMAARKHFDNVSWCEWPDNLKHRSSETMQEFRELLAADISLFIFEQFAYFEQWGELRHYASERDVKLFGDMPIFVAHDSADVWAAQKYFNLDEHGAALTVAGVPPDYFSETGQHWGNPHYNWQAMEASGFSWWLERLQTQLKQFDLIRIDHFRGFEAFWEIPSHHPDARNGQWVKAPGDAFLSACFKAYPSLPLVAENLGLITPEVEALRHKFNLPGMLVLQFAFDGNTKNPHLPHNHSLSDVIYTGTHDNDTSLGWHQALNQEQQAITKKYLFSSEQSMPWLLIDAALASVAPMAILPLQDVLELDGNHRMNVPGTTGINWTWQFSWDQFSPNLSDKLRAHLERYDRLI